MARGNKDIPGQLTFDFSIDSSQYVVQSNALACSKQELKLNSMKLIRAAIMQVVYEDKQLKPYKISIKELSELLQVDESNLYRSTEDLVNDILENPVCIQEFSGKSVRWAKIPWCTKFEYVSDVGFLIKLNDELKPFLLGLRKDYMRYPLQDILPMKSTYSIRLYELIFSKIRTDCIPKGGKIIEVSLQEIRECCGCENKTYDVFGNLRKRVIDPSVKEINEKTLYKISTEYIKESRACVGVRFIVQTSW